MDSLDVFLYNELIGTIVQLPGDRNVFTFQDRYSEDRDRPTLSLSFRDSFGSLITDLRSTRTRLSPFFSNLLPEGYLRAYLASQAKVSEEREFYLLRALGEDLPGALTIRPARESKSSFLVQEEGCASHKEDGVLHFSLAGVQLKFSAERERSGRLTIPANGIGGSWIVKIPSHTYAKVPENEYAMMSLAKQVGINVPEILLLPIEQVRGIPSVFQKAGEWVYAIKRFDRGPKGEKIHIEDFAQVFQIYPEKKYSAANYRNIAEVLWRESGEKAVEEFIRRFIFNALIGNGDMHLKNWSLLYPDRKTAQLSPAYDFVSTIVYLPGDQLALNFVDSKDFQSLSLEQLQQFSKKGGMSEELVLETALSTVKKFKTAWDSVGDFHLDDKVIRAIEAHYKTIPIYSARD